jgi:radical SAM superfamily enzyme YgiQ (UPF0313 family)
MRILFTYPFFLKNSALEREWMMPYFPLGLLYLAATARAEGHSVAVFDGTFESDESAFEAALDTFQPQVVCIASLITLRPAALALGQHSAKGGLTVLYGGPDPTLDPQAYLHPGAVVVYGEGEQTLVELLHALAQGADLVHVNGIRYHTSAGIQQTVPRDPLWQLDQLPWPARDLLPITPYFEAWKAEHGYHSITLAASRGCPYGCEHCTNAANGPHFRRRSPQSVAQEMQHLEALYAPDRFRLVDDLEGLGEAWLRELGQAMLDLGIQTPYEGLQPIPYTDLPMYQFGKGLCGKRNRYIPRVSEHPHAPPALTTEELQQRWGAGIVPQHG